jgi:hypothetical protein
VPRVASPALRALGRGQIIVFPHRRSPAVKCGEGGTYVKRLHRPPWRRLGGAQRLRLHRRAANLRALRHGDRRDCGDDRADPDSKGPAFMIGDNRSGSCDSRSWGTVPRKNLIGTVVATYWRREHDPVTARCASLRCRMAEVETLSVVAAEVADDLIDRNRKGTQPSFRPYSHGPRAGRCSRRAGTRGP